MVANGSAAAREFGAEHCRTTVGERYRAHADHDILHAEKHPVAEIINTFIECVIADTQFDHPVVIGPEQQNLVRPADFGRHAAPEKQTDIAAVMSCRKGLPVHRDAFSRVSE